MCRTLSFAPCLDRLPHRRDAQGYFGEQDDMKILLVGRSSSEHVQNWSRALKDAGEEVHLYSPFQRAYSGPGGSNQSRTQMVTFVRERRRLSRVIKALSPDVVNVHYASGPGLLASRLFSPTVVTVYGSDVTEFPLRGKLQKKALQRCLVSAEAITVASSDLRRCVEELQFAAQTPAIVPFGVDIRRYRMVERPLTKVRRLVIGTTKGCEEVYGIDLLIRAFALMRLAIPTELEAELQVFGGGSKVKEYSNLAEEMGVGNLVVFKGRVSHDDIPAILQGFDIFVAPSRRESFGVAVIEAMASGIPCVVSDAGGLPEIAENGAAKVVPSGDTTALAARLIELANSPKRRAELGIRGRARAEHFDFEECTEAMLTVFRGVAQ